MVLINAVTGHVPIGHFSMSGYATYRDLGIRYGDGRQQSVSITTFETCMESHTNP
jgi:hypothetical protein